MKPKTTTWNAQWVAAEYRGRVVKAWVEVSTPNLSHENGCYYARRGVHFSESGAVATLTLLIAEIGERKAVVVEKRTKALHKEDVEGPTAGFRLLKHFGDVVSPLPMILIGARETHSHGWVESTTEGSRFEPEHYTKIYLRTKLGAFTVDIDERTQVCPSGYSEGQGDDIDELRPISGPFGPMTHTAADPKCATVFVGQWVIMDETGNALFHIEDRGCEYYPSEHLVTSPAGAALLAPTARRKEKQIVYVFTGPSGIGKSYLGMAIKKDRSHTVHETDSTGQPLPDYEDVPSVIVLGNKHGLTIADVESALAEKNINADIVVVDFKKGN